MPCHGKVFMVFHINLGLSLTVLPLAQAEMVEHVVIISFDGLRPDALTILGAANLPTFYKIIQTGASTLNARADYDKTETLPNLTFLHFCGPDKTGHTSGWDVTNSNSAYMNTIKQMDDYLQSETRLHSGSTTNS